jgi:Flp pilus assembly protein TadG
MTSRRTHRRSARGQIVPMAGLMMVLLLGFVALVVDGGRGYLDRRELQSTADTAALSGAGQLSVSGHPKTDLSYARAAAINEAVANLPGTTVPSAYSYSLWAGKGSTSTCASYPLQCDISGLSLGNTYSVDVQATVLTVKVTLHHSLPLTFGIAAGFGPSISPSATATAENGALGFALILFRNNSTGNAQYGNLTLNGSSTVLNIRAASTAPAGTTGDAMTNESICPAPGTVDFDYEGDMYAYTTSGWSKFPGGSCGSSSNVTRTASGETLIQQPQIANPNYPEPSVTGTCSVTYACNTDVKISTSGSVCLQPGTYSSLDVAKGTVVLAPGAFKFNDSTGKDVGVAVGSSAAVTTIGKASSPSSAASTCGLPSVPSDSGVTIEMVPSGSAGNKNQLNVSSGASFAISGSPTNRDISLYIENSSTGDPCFWNSLQGCGSSVVVFSSGATYNVGGVVYGYGDNMTFGGGSGGAGIGQVFAWTVTVNGNGTVTETYDPAQRPFLQGLIN